MNSGSEFRPDVGPRFLAQHAARQLAASDVLDASRFTRRHVPSIGQALVQIGFADIGQQGKPATVGGAKFGLAMFSHSREHSDSLRATQDLSAIRYEKMLYPLRSEMLERGLMETASRRRKRKLTDLCEKYGAAAVAKKAGLNPFALEQIVKGTLLPAKKDGSREPRSLGNAAARAIEAAYPELGAGWFDAPEEAAKLSDDTLALAFSYEKMSPTEKQRLRLLMLAARDGVNPTSIADAPRDRKPPPQDNLGGDSWFDRLDAPEPASDKSKSPERHKRGGKQ